MQRPRLITLWETSLKSVKWHKRSKQNEMKWNESGFRPPLCTYRLNWARRTSWGWWDEWPDTGFEIRALAVWGRARYLSVTEAPHNTDFHTWMGKKHFCFFETAETGNQTPNSGVKGSGANHYLIGPPPTFQATRCQLTVSLYHVYYHVLWVAWQQRLSPLFSAIINYT